MHSLEAPDARRIVSITVPGVPVAWQRVGHRHMADGRVISYTPDKTRRHQNTMLTFAKLAMGGRPLFEMALHVTFEVVLPVPASWSNVRKAAALAGTLHATGKPDLDNFVKQLDALTGIVWIDDAQIITLAALKRYGREPGLLITVQG